MKFIELADLTPFASIDEAKAKAMIEDAEALAITSAPCLNGELTPEQVASVRAILRTAILRWNDAGNGALTQETAGPYSATYDTRSTRYGGLTDGETSRLRSICSGGGGARRVFTITQGAATPSHTPWCNLRMGGSWCSCGSYLTRGEFPLYEVGERP